MEKMKLQCWQKISLAFCGAIVLASSFLFAPFVQNLILDFAERFVVHRSLTRMVWIGLFAKYATINIAFFTFALYCNNLLGNCKKIKNPCSIFFSFFVCFFDFNAQSAKSFRKRSFLYGFKCL